MGTVYKPFFSELDISPLPFVKGIPTDPVIPAGLDTFWVTSSTCRIIPNLHFWFLVGSRPGMLGPVDWA